MLLVNLISLEYFVHLRQKLKFFTNNKNCEKLGNLWHVYFIIRWILVNYLIIKYKLSIYPLFIKLNNLYVFVKIISIKWNDGNQNILYLVWLYVESTISTCTVWSNISTGNYNCSNKVQNQLMHFVCTSQLCELTQHQLNATPVI